MKFLERIQPKAKYVDYFKTTVLDLWQEQGVSLEQEVKLHENQLKQLEERKKRIQEMREDGSYTKEEFLDRKQGTDHSLLKFYRVMN